MNPTPVIPAKAGIPLFVGSEEFSGTLAFARVTGGKYT
jgi:hypothetical protein